MMQRLHKTLPPLTDQAISQDDEELAVDLGVHAVVSLCTTWPLFGASERTSWRV